MRNLFSKHHLHIICLTLLTTFGFQSAIQAQQQSWFDNKYSMFIHFGIYSQPAGIWKGKEIPNYSEQIQAHGGIYSDVYRDLSLSFNPEKWDATEVVKLAKRNGMRSVVFTTKHHDGFCMYNSAYTKFDIMDATPYKKDVLLTLAEACKAEGLKMGLYFSLIDWTQHPITAQNINNITDQHHRYNLNQIEELLTNYGPISELWFDMGSLSEAQSREMYNLVHRLQPDCMVSGRLGNNCYDFCVMGDNEYPDYTLVRPWQTAASIYTETWSYRSWQQYSEVKAKVEEKIIALTRVVSRGGNYLLNIGPKGDGSIVKHEEEVLDGIGNWISRNEAALYGVKASPFGNETFAWGDVVSKENTLYLYLNGDKSIEFELPVKKSVIRNVSVVGSKDKVRTKATEAGIRISLAESVYANPVPVIKVELTKTASITPFHPIRKATSLSYKNAENSYSFACIDYYTTHRSVIGQTWKWESKKTPVLVYPVSEAGKELRCISNGTAARINLEATEEVTVKPAVKVLETTYTQPKGASFLWSEEKMNKLSFMPLNAENPFDINMNLPRPTQMQTAVFVKQRIQSEGKQFMQMEIEVESGLMVFHNGNEVIKNLGEGKQTILLELENGENEVVIKLLSKKSEMAQILNIRIPEQFKLCRQPLTGIRTNSGANTLHLEGFEEMEYPQSLHEPAKTNNLFIEI